MVLRNARSSTSMVLLWSRCPNERRVHPPAARSALNGPTLQNEQTKSGIVLASEHMMPKTRMELLGRQASGEGVSVAIAFQTNSSTPCALRSRTCACPYVPSRRNTTLLYQLLHFRFRYSIQTDSTFERQTSRWCRRNISATRGCSRWTSASLQRSAVGNHAAVGTMHIKLLLLLLIILITLAEP